MLELEQRRFDFFLIALPLLQLLRPSRDFIIFEKSDFLFFVEVTVEVLEFILRSERTEVENCFNNPLGVIIAALEARF